MAPKVKVPMDFGRHLLGSPTHSNLTLNTKLGGKVRASSVILSFNSQLIDHMTSSLHMTSVDMLEFSEAAVQVFVDAAYSGTVEGLTRELFRDVNKIANVFDVSWLAGKCSEFFTEVADSVKTPSYTELLYLFEEASFVYENLKTKEYINVVIKKIESLSWKKEFVEKYLENLERLSTGKLDMVIDLAGSEVSCVVETVTKQLTELVKIPDSHLPSTCKYLLDNLDLFVLKDANTELFDRLFNVLGGLPDKHIRWTFSLMQKAMKPHLLPSTPKPSTSFSSVETSSESLLTTVRAKTATTSTLFGMGAITNAPSSSPAVKSSSVMSSNSVPKKFPFFLHETRVSETEVIIPNIASSSSVTETSRCVDNPRCNIIPNMFQELNVQNLTIHGLLDFLESSEKVTCTLLALEALWTWSWYGKTNDSQVYNYLMNATLKAIAEKRSWPGLPPMFQNKSFKFSESNLGLFETSSFISSPGNFNFYKYVDIPCIRSEGLMQGPHCGRFGDRICLIDYLSGCSRHIFIFSHPSVKSCNLPGSCGFILETVSGETVLRNLVLCTEEEDYHKTNIHFHEEIRAEKMHVYIERELEVEQNLLDSLGCKNHIFIIPLSWSILREDIVKLKRIHGFRSNHRDRLCVLYEI